MLIESCSLARGQKDTASQKEAYSHWNVPGGMNEEEEKTKQEVGYCT